ncbi:hypothetical protein Q7P37_007284 [Cladosporium fusiforme]
MSALLWQSDDELTTLIDIPHSISLAQGDCHGSTPPVLLSTEPLRDPHQTNEPKTAAARAKLVYNTVDADLHAEYAAVIHNSLAKIKTSHHGSWCMPRPLTGQQTGSRVKRKASSPVPRESQLHESSESTQEPHRDIHPCDSLPKNFLSSLSAKGVTKIHGVEPEDTLYQDDEPFACDEQSANTTGRTTLPLADPRHPSARYRFYLPQNSSFILGSCSDSRTLHTSIRLQAQELDVQKAFDFILLDPPWPNRSVKRTHKTAQSTYSTAPTLDDLFQLLAGMDLDMVMADSGLVAIWITNKPAVRELVLGQDGLFDSWGVELVEEWIWLKTTETGAPVTPVESVWRKPYEILLLGRKRRRYLEPSQQIPAEHEGVRRRVLVSVPDLHSRKPCLKEMIEKLVPDPSSYRALEVFARHLVAGWWSWGDECIKFNWEGFWREQQNL